MSRRVNGSTGADGGAPTTPGSRSSVGPAIAVLIDYDGTIAGTDVSDELVRPFADPQAWDALIDDYHQGRLGSRAVVERQAGMVRGHEEAIRAALPDPDHDATFLPFLARLREWDLHVEVVSDGLGFFVPEALTRLGAAGLPVFAASATFSDGMVTIGFPHGNPDCSVCGTCKRQRVMEHRRHGCHVVFVGDGFSDLYASAHADSVLAKGLLAELCATSGVPFEPWRTFEDVQARVAALLEQGASPGGERDYRCGPEAWGPDPRWPAPLGPASLRR